MTTPLSAYAFNVHGGDAALYNGIHDLEQRITQLEADLGESRRYAEEASASYHGLCKYVSALTDERSKLAGTVAQLEAENAELKTNWKVAEESWRASIKWNQELDIKNDVLAAENAELRAKAALNESQTIAAIATEKRDAAKALLALAGAHFVTSAEGYGFNSSWVISDLCRCVAELRKDFGEIGANAERFRGQVYELEAMVISRNSQIEEFVNQGAKQRDQIEELRKQKEISDELAKDRHELFVENCELKAQVDELRKDKERLDWLEIIGFTTRDISPTSDPVGGVHYWSSGTESGWTARGISSKFQTAREAIDAAMEGK